MQWTKCQDFTFSIVISIVALAPFCWSICVQKTRSSFQVALSLLAGSKVVRTMIMKIYIFQSRLELSNRQCLCGKTIFLDELNGNKMFSPQNVYLRRRKTCGWRQIAETQLQVAISRLAQPSSGEQRISPKYASETLHSSAVSMNREN